MKIYFIHATSYPNFKDELYDALSHSDLNGNHTFIFPHQKSDTPINSKNIISESDLILAEVSYPSTGLGIELGWAEAANKKILCIYKAGSKPSQSIKEVSSDFIEYSDKTTMIDQIASWIESYKKTLISTQPNFSM